MSSIRGRRFGLAAVLCGRGLARLLSSARRWSRSRRACRGQKALECGARENVLCATHLASSADARGRTAARVRQPIPALRLRASTIAVRHRNVHQRTRVRARFFELSPLRAAGQLDRVRHCHASEARSAVAGETANRNAKQLCLPRKTRLPMRAAAATRSSPQHHASIPSHRLNAPPPLARANIRERHHPPALLPPAESHPSPCTDASRPGSRSRRASVYLSRRPSLLFGIAFLRVSVSLWQNSRFFCHN